MDAPENTGDEPEEEDRGENEDEAQVEDEKISVRFVCNPEDMSLQVYPARTAEETQSLPIEAEADGSYLLLPGEYFYNASREGYISAENVPFVVEKGEKEKTIAVELANADGNTAQEPVKTEESQEPEVIIEEAPEVQMSVFAAAPAAATSGYCGAETNTDGERSMHWELSDNGRHLSIIGYEEMVDFEDESPWYAYRESITNIFISDGITKIGANAFAGCENIEYVHYAGTWDEWNEIVFGENNLPLINATISASTATGDYGQYLTWDIRDGRMNIFGSGDMCDFPENGAPWFSYREEIQSVYLSGDISSIGDYAFSGLYRADSITIPDSVTAIGDYAFCGCRELTSITIPDSVTTIGDYALAGCEKLTGITISDSITAIGDSAFSGCTGLKSVSILNGVTTISDYAFANCTGLKNITIPEGVTTIGNYAFIFCTGLTSITIPDSVTSIGDKAFYLDMPLDTTINVLDGENINPALSGYDWVGDNRTVQYLSSDDTPIIGKTGVLSYRILNKKVTITGCDSNATGSLTIPAKIEGCDVVAIGNDAFNGVGGITSISLPNSLKTISIPAGVESIGEGAFRSYTLTAINVSSANAHYSSVDGVLFNKDKTRLIQYPNAKSNTAYTVPSTVNEICDRAFSWNSYLSKLTIGGNVSRIGTYAFYNCSNLQEVILPQGLTEIEDDCFVGCTNLKSIVIPDSVVSIGEDAFNSSGLFYICIPRSVTSIGVRAFGACSKLTDIYFAHEEGDALSFNGYSYAFNVSSNVDTNVYVPNAGKINPAISKYDWSGSNRTVQYLSSDDTPIIGKTGVLSYKIINKKVTITGCDRSATGSLTIPAKIEGCDVVAIGNNAFNNASGITAISLPNSLKTIGAGAFSGLYQLKSISIPAGVESIGEGAFRTDTMSGQLSAINVSSANAHYSSVDGVLFNKDKTRLIRYPEAKSNTAYTVPSTVNEICDRAFSSSNYLSKVTIGGNVSRIGKSAFFYCDELQEVILPQGLTEIEDGCFDVCTNLKSIVIPDSVVSIGQYAFSNTGLPYICIPRSVTSIGVRAFGACSKLTDIYFAHEEGDALSFNGYSYAFNVSSNVDTNVYVPNAGKINSAISKYNWSGSNRTVQYRSLRVNYCDIVYHLNGGINSPRNPHRITNVSFVELSDPSRAGYAFAGWYANGNFTGGKITKISGSTATELYAKWDKISYSIAFNANGGRGSMAAVTSCKTDVEVSLPANRFTRVGYSFAGWSSKADGSGELYSDCDRVINLTDVNKGTATLYARWMPVSYCVRFDPNGGSRDMEDQVLIYGTAQSLSPNAFERVGYSFAGWKLGNTAYSDEQTVLNLSSVQDGIVTLVAQWKPKTYTLSFDPNGGSGSMAAQTLTYDKAAALRGNAFRYSGRVFAGWALEPDAPDAAYRNGESVMNLSPATAVTLYAVWKDKKATAVDILHEGAVVSGSGIGADMHDIGTYKLDAQVYPADASGLVQWKTASPAIATVDGDGLVTFHKPGTVTITATTTDGSNKTANVKLDVIFIDKATRLTCSTDMPKIGLQVEDTAFLSVFGTDKTTALDPRLFSYEITTRDGDKYLRNHNDGCFTALAPNKTVTVKATLIDDPLKRSVTATIKTIPVQTGKVFVEPAELSADYVVGVDALGNVCPISEALSYAILVDKADVNRSYTLRVSANDSHGAEISGLTGSSFNWASNAAGVASVAVSRTGEVNITVRAKATGACTITATSKDIAKTQGSIAVYVRDYAPRLDAATVTLDSAKTNEARLNLVPSYGNTVNQVKIYENGSISPNLSVKSYDPQTGELVIRANAYIPNKSLRTKLAVECDSGTYEFNLGVNVRNSAPGITVKQTKFNLFYLDSESVMDVTVKGETVTDITLESDYFEKNEGEGGSLTVKYADGIANYGKVNTNLKLHIQLAGYDNAIVKDVRLTTETKKPTVKLSETSGTVNTKLSNNPLTFTVIPSDGAVLPDNSISADPAVDAGNIGNLITFNPPVGGAYKAGTVKLSVKAENWSQSIPCSYTIRLINTAPVIKPVKTTLTLNSNIPSACDKTAVTTGVGNVPATAIGNAVLTKVGTNAEADKIRVEYNEGVISASLTDSSVKPGTYSYSFIPEYEGMALNKLTVSVRVDGALPTARLKKTYLNLSGYFTGAEGETQVSLTNDSFSVAGIDGYTATGWNAAEAMENVALTYDEPNGLIRARFTGAHKKAATYTFSIPVALKEGTGLKAKTNVILVVKLTDDRPKVSLSAVTVKLNSELAGKELGSVSVSAAAIEGYSLSWALTEPASSCIVAESHTADGQIWFYLDSSKTVKPGSSRYTITPKLTSSTDAGDVIELKPLALTVQVYTNKSIGATVTMTGKPDAVRRDIPAVLTVTGLRNISAGEIVNVELDGKDKDKFVLSPNDNGELVYTNSRGQSCVNLKLKARAEYDSKTTYKLQLRLSVAALGGETEVLSNELNVRVSQSSIRLTATPTVQTIYQSQSRERWVTYKLELTSPDTAEIGMIETGNVSIFQKSLVNVSDNILLNIEGKTATVRVRLKDTSCLVAGRSYTLPLEVKAEGAFTGSAPTKINLTLKVMK